MEFAHLPVYAPLFNDYHRYSVIYGGAGSGKSQQVAMAILLKLMTEEYHRVLGVRKTYHSLKDSVYLQLVTIINEGGLGEYFKINASPLKIVFLPNGNEILFYGLDDVNKLKSIVGVTIVWVEEATEITQTDFDQLVLRVRGKESVRKSFYLTFNPTDSDIWIKSRFIDNVRPDALVLKTTYKDNQFIDAGYIEAIEAFQLSNPNYHKIYALGEWGGGQVGQIFTNWLGGEWDEGQITTKSYGLDFGFSTDPTALIEVGVSGIDGSIYLRQLLYKKGLTSDDLVTALAQLSIKKDQPMVADSSRPETIESLRRAGYNIYPSDKTIKVFEQLNRISNKRILVCGSPDLVNELKMYTFKIRADGKPLQEPIDAFNHLIDAFRYGLQKAGREEPQWRTWSASIRGKVY